VEDLQNFQNFCVIGAGPSGLTAAKNLKQRGISLDCFEREDDVGGNWYFGKPCSSVYQSTHLISSKRLTEFTDFPMPDEYPPFPSHQQVLEYLRAYARKFGLYDDITFRTSVLRVEPAGDGWDVTLSDGQPPRRYRGVIIANGHHWDPLMPEFAGGFDGQMIHAHDYKTPDVLRGRRVLVVGAGNSGCDIAVEAAQNATATFHSLRRGYHFLPKFLLGKPIDVCGERLLRWRLPLWLRRTVSSVLVKVALGSPQRYGLPKPDHKLFETHPIINSQLLYYVGHGAIRVKPHVERLCGDRVRFTDGSEEQVDLIVCATGYKLSFPFIDQQHLAWHDGQPQFYLNVFHPRHDHLFVAGLIQPDSGLWGLADYQSQLIASFITSIERDPPTAAWFRRLKATAHEDLGHGIDYVDSPRHAIEVEHFSYRERLKRLLKKFG
jgi:cation diffusion facilitator CzcD-associated flavoprotein CzcO